MADLQPGDIILLPDKVWHYLESGPSSMMVSLFVFPPPRNPWVVLGAPE
jgi:quercetin dioxygenase-like cupin family protein